MYLTALLLSPPVVSLTSAFSNSGEQDISRGDRRGAETAASLHRCEHCEKYDDQ